MRGRRQFHSIQDLDPQNLLAPQKKKINIITSSYLQPKKGIHSPGEALPHLGCYAIIKLWLRREQSNFHEIYFFLFLMKALSDGIILT